jgi:hypothetical protein
VRPNDPGSRKNDHVRALVTGWFTKASRHHYLAITWFAALALVVLGPLVAPGYLLLLDAPVGPTQPPLSLFPGPSQGLYSVGAPTSVAVLAAARVLGLVAPELLNQIMMGAAIIIGGWGLYRFCNRDLGLDRPSSIAAGTLYAINPFVYERLLAGQLFIALGYALLPWALPTLAALTETGSWPRAFAALTWCFAISLVSVHLGGMALVLALAGILVAPRTIPIRITMAAIVVLGLFLLQAYWILPAWDGSQASGGGLSDLAVFAPRPRTPAILTWVLLLHGFWRAEYPTPLSQSPGLFLASFLPLLAIAATGSIAAIQSAAARRWYGVLGSTALIAIILGMGTSFRLTSGVTRWLYLHVPGYSIYREPHKWVALVALAYAVFLGVGLHHIASVVQRVRRMVPHVALLAPPLTLVASGLMLWGLGGQVRTSEYPLGWERAASLIQDQEGSLLFLPWHEFQSVPFAGGRVIHTPAENFFEAPVLTSTDDEFLRRRASPVLDPRDAYISTVLRGQRSLEHFGSLVAPLGVRYIGLATWPGGQSYRFLNRQRDLRLLSSGHGFTLYENVAWRDSFYGLRRTRATTLRNVLTDASAQDVASEALIPLDPLVARPGTASLDVWGFDPFIPQRIRAPFIGTSLSCIDGWRLGDEEALCHLGALAAFRNRAPTERLRSTFFGIQSAGYVVSGVALAALVIGLLRRRRRRQRDRP